VGGWWGQGYPRRPEKGACKAIKLHDTLLKQVSLGFNSTIVSAKRRYRAILRITTWTIVHKENQNE
jgi:hypothetical protein